MPAITRPIQPERHSLKAPIEPLNLAYTRLLSELTLSNTHRESLIKRGLLQAQISVLNYKSMPESDRDIVIQRILNRVSQSGTSSVQVGNPVAGLLPATTYHFRTVALNSAGTNYGPLTTLWFDVPQRFDARRVSG